MTTFSVPSEWKSANWWRNRPVDERVFHAKFPKRLMSLGAVSIPNEIQTWIDNFEPGNSLYIHGRTGVGKSVLATAVAKRLINSGNSGRFVPSETYLEMLKDQFDNDNVLPEMYSSPYLVKYIQGVWDVVVLDGVGQERETDFANHEIGSLIRRRYDDLRSLIITSSLGTIDFNRRYGERISSAIGDMTVYRMT
jgi:DNA replication protein DnaC